MIDLQGCGQESCVTTVRGCLDPSKFNYDSTANTEIAGDCQAIVYGCTDRSMYNWEAAANTENVPSSCVAYSFGCTDANAFNHDPAANCGLADNLPDNCVDTSVCVARVSGCTDNAKFNYNPAANTDDSSCVDFIHAAWMRALTTTIRRRTHTMAAASFQDVRTQWHRSTRTLRIKMTVRV